MNRVHERSMPVPVRGGLRVRLRILVPVVLAALLLGTLPASAAPPLCAVPQADDRCELWSTVHAGSSSPGPFDPWYLYFPVIAASPLGERVYVASPTAGQGNSIGISTIASDGVTGETLWTHRLEPADLQARPRDIAVSPSGDLVAVAGADRLHVNLSGEVTKATGLVALYGSDGSLRWKSDFQGGDGPVTLGTSVAFSPDSSIVYASFNAPGGFRVVAIDVLAGDQIWSETYPLKPGNHHAVRLMVSPDGGRLYVAGTEGSALTSSLDVPTLHRAEGGDFLGMAIEATGPAAGSVSWIRRFGGSSGEKVADAELSPDGRSLIVAGTSVGETGQQDALIISYDAATGDENWIARYDRAGGVDYADSIAISPDGSSVAVRGSAAIHDIPPTNLEPAVFDPFTTLLDTSSGQQRWASVQPTPLVTLSAGVEFSSDGARIISATAMGTPLLISFSPQVVVTAWTSHTVALSASTGEQAWAALATHEADSAMTRAISSAGGRVFVAGGKSLGMTDVNPAMTTELFTLAYEA